MNDEQDTGFYNELAEYYDPLYSTMKSYDDECRRLCEILGREGVNPGAGHRILDAACGTGEHLKYLRDSYEVAGFDRNEGMLDIARRKVPGIELFRADMVDFTVAQPYDVILCLFSSIGYVFPENRLQQAARSFAAAVRPGGVLIIEPWLSPDVFMPGRAHMQTYESDDLKLCRASISKVEGSLSIIQFHWLIARTGADDVEHVVDRHELFLCSPEVLADIFNEAGFEIEFTEDGLMPGRGLIVGRKR
jgi:SAM-dependent methyltransferase